MQQPLVNFNNVFCPECQDYVQILKISKAAKVANVSAKTIYTYVEDGSVHSMKVGKTLRVCVPSLIHMNGVNPVSDGPLDPHNGNENRLPKKHEGIGASSKARIGLGHVPRK